MSHALRLSCCLALISGLFACDPASDASPIDELPLGEPPSARLDVIFDGQPLPKWTLGEETFVQGVPDQEYEVRVTVSAGEKFKAVVMVDGINTYDGSKVAKHGLIYSGTATVRGFRVNDRQVDGFRFSTPDQSVAAARGDTRHLGEIVALVYLDDPSAREDTPLYGHKNMKSFGAVVDEPGNLGTGTGRRLYDPIGFGTSFTQRPGPPLAKLRLRYDDRAGLCRRGIRALCESG